MKLEPGIVYELSYYVDTPGPHVEEDTIECYWTGALEGGKLVIVNTDGSPTLYLFEREIVDAHPAYAVASTT